jgi:cytoskeletal protein RodZ
VFNKGFVRAFAQFIGIDADAMVTAYLDEERQQAGTADLPAAAPDVAPPSGLRWWVATLIAVLVLLVVAAGLTAFGYGPLASKFKALRSDAPRQAAVEART